MLSCLNKFVLAKVTFILFITTISSYVNAQTTYTIGIVPQFEARKLRMIWKPILNHLERETGFKFIIRGSPTIPAFEKEFNEGVFDFAYMNPYHIMLANKSQGYIPFVRDIETELYGILVVSKNSNIKRVEDLNGKLIAFPAPNALGASLLLRTDLREKFKIDFEETYVKSHSSVYLNVALAQASAGGGVQKTLNRQKSSVQKRLKVLYETEKLPPHPIVAHPRVPLNDIEAMKKALLKLSDTEEGRAQLSKIPIKKIGTTDISDYLRLKTMGLEKYYVNP